MRALTAALLLSPFLVAQADWRQIVPGTPAPRGRELCGLTFDFQQGSVLLFGGYSLATGNLRDTWQWNGATWTRIVPANSPSGRHEFGMVGFGSGVLLFGGYDNVALADTWQWNGADWSRIVPSTSPPARSGHSMVHDTGRGRVLLFGGNGAAGELNDTWQWDGNDWTRLAPAVSPPARGYFGLAYDPVRDHVVLFGGRAGGSLRSDTWVWDGASWSHRTPANSPPPRAFPGMAYDAVRDRVVLFSGQTAGGNPADTWEWDGAIWVQATPATAPVGRAFHRLTFDPARGEVLAFAGSSSSGPRNDTWSYGTAAVAVFAPFGAGCAGSAGLPELMAAPGQRPWLGDPFTVRLSPLPSAGFAFLGFGTSSTTFPGGSLPFDLGAFGMPGCLLRISPDFFLALPNRGGFAESTLPIPNVPALVGRTFFEQGLVQDPAANRFGMTATNGAALTPGIR